MSFARKILDLQIFQFEIRYCISFSVTRFGKISPLWHNFKSLGQFFEGLISIWKKFNLTLAKMLSYRASLHCCRWPQTLKQFNHLVTLAARHKSGSRQRDMRQKRVKGPRSPCHPRDTDKKVSQILVTNWKKYPCQFH